MYVQKLINKQNSVQKHVEATRKAEHFVGMPDLTYRTQKGKIANWLAKPAEKHFREHWDSAYQQFLTGTLPEGPIVVPTRHPVIPGKQKGKLFKGITATSEKKIEQLNQMAAKTYRDRNSKHMLD